MSEEHKDKNSDRVKQVKAYVEAEPGGKEDGTITVQKKEMPRFKNGVR
jgi:hypothetical protein